MRSFLLVLWAFGLLSCRSEKIAESAAESSLWHELMEPEIQKSWQKVAYGKQEMVHWESDGAEKSRLSCDMGAELIGARWTGELPKVPYELELEARRMNGNDFFCGLTFPVRRDDELVTLVVGGWGGAVVGISSIDGLDAANNQTTTRHDFKQKRWYRVKIRVEEAALSAWIDDEKVLALPLMGKKLALRPGPIAQCAPLGIGAWQTGAEFRKMRWRSLK